jgi:hypothetical protein
MIIESKKLVDLTSSDIEEIQGFLKSNFCTVFHEPEFNRIVSTVFGTDFSYRLVYNSDRKIIALCPLHSVKEGLLSRTYSNPAIYDVRYGGWAYDRKKVSIAELMAQLRVTVWDSLVYWSVPQVNGDDYTFMTGKRRFETGIIDLSLSVDDILHKCISRKRRETIRSAMRKGVIVEKLNHSNLSTFVEQCSYLKESVGLKSLPSDFFISLFEQYAPHNKIAVFASVLNGEHLATGMVVGNRHMIHLWVAGKPKTISQNVPRQDLLVMETIKWAKETGSRYYDLCVLESERLPTIARFKLGFSKQIVPFYCITGKGFGHRIISRARKVLGAK